MQQNLRFPAQCTVIPAEELEQVSGGAPAWVGELKDQIRPYCCLLYTSDAADDV